MQCPKTSVAFFIFVLTVAAGCSTANPYYDQIKPHHTAEGFKNNYAPTVNKSFSELILWQIERRQQGVPKPPDVPTPVMVADVAAIKNYALSATPLAPQITWIGHASVLVQAGGLNIITDPIFSNRASPVQFLGPQRLYPPGLALDDLPLIDVVLISHNHYDHLDKASVQSIAQRSLDAGKSTLFLVPLGVKLWFSDLGIQNVIEMDWWDQHTVRGVEFNFTPVQHWSARGFGDRSQTLWGGYAVFAPDFHLYFTGDTGYSKDFTDTNARFAKRQTAAQGGGFDLALIPLGAYEPRWFMKEQHINPAEAMQIHKDLRAKRSIGVHWGTFDLTDKSLDQPPKDMAVARAAQGLRDAEFTVMAIGETRRLPARATSEATTISAKP
jgi:N-acyl-phosphatidylethanolamine-hydrolysing phospholipase D